MAVTILDTTMPAGVVKYLAELRRDFSTTSIALGNNSEEAVLNAAHAPYLGRFEQKPFTEATMLLVRDFLFQLRNDLYGFKLAVPHDAAATDYPTIADPEGESDVVQLVVRYGNPALGAVYEHPVRYPDAAPTMKVSTVEDTGASHLGGGRVRMTVDPAVPANTTWTAGYKYPFRIFGKPWPVSWSQGLFFLPDGGIREVI